MSHKVENLHILCTEPRIQEIYYQYLVDNNLLGKFDTVQFANPILALGMADTRLSTLKKIEDIIGMHGNSKIVLFDHLDCGAYKLSFRFKDFKQELKKHHEINKEVINLLQNNFPNVKIELKMIKINNDGSCEWYQPD